MHGINYFRYMKKDKLHINKFSEFVVTIAGLYM